MATLIAPYLFTWKEDTPVPSILVEVFAKIEVVLQDKGAICDVGATNKHAGLLEGRESLYPKLKQY